MVYLVFGESKDMIQPILETIILSSGFVVLSLCLLASLSLLRVRKASKAEV